LKVIWTPEAQRDREDIWEFIANENPFAATRMDELFSEAAGQIPGTRKLFPHDSYRMV
jgi:plasmid stabilization system protein ParE